MYAGRPLRAQKTLLAKCLFAGPRERRLAVVLLTEDLIELLGPSDRILVMNRGHIRKELRREEVPSEREVVGYMV